MTAQRNPSRRTTSAKDREFERLLRRAALYYAKRKTAPAVSIARRKRVKAA